MADTDLQISFGADVSGIQTGVDQARDAIAGLDPALAGLAAPVQAFQAAVVQAFGDTSAASGWAASVQQACAQASAASTAAASAVQSHWKMSLDPIGSMFARNINSLLQGTQTFGQAFLHMGDQMLSRFLGWCLQMAERWAVKELTQTAASTAGATVRTATEVSAQGAGLAASGATALADIGNSAARAAAGAYAAIASVPIVGPVLAPAAAATALAAVVEFGSHVFSAAGGWGQVPYDDALTALHRDEMVLPAAIASPLRSMLGGGAGLAGATALGGAAFPPGAASQTGGSSGAGSSGAVHHHWNIQALDAKSFARLVAANPQAITGGLTRAVQRLGVTPASIAAKGGAR